MSDELPQENSQTLKDEIKQELKQEFYHIRQKRKHRVLKSVGIFVLGLVIGFGGGMASGHHHSFAPHGHFQQMHHMQK